MPFSLIWTDTFKLTDSEIYLLDVGTHDESYGVMVIILVAMAVPPPIVAVALIATVCGDVAGYVAKVILRQWLIHPSTIPLAKPDPSPKMGMITYM